MNRRPSGLQLSKALVGFLQYKAAEGLSPNTLCNYEDHLTVWLDYAGDIETSQVTSQDLRAYLAWLRTDYKPRRLTGGDQPLAPKTVRNVWVTLSSFFTWASMESEHTVSLSPAERVPPGPGSQKASWRGIAARSAAAGWSARPPGTRWTRGDPATDITRVTRSHSLTMLPLCLCLSRHAGTELLSSPSPQLTTSPACDRIKSRRRWHHDRHRDSEIYAIRH